MGYTTTFDGQFTFSRELTLREYNTLRKVAHERHDRKTHPDYYCQWIPTDDGLGLRWDGNEKFSSYKEWLEYLIKHYFKPWGVVLSGEVFFRGEERRDVGSLVVVDNLVSIRR